MTTRMNSPTLSRHSTRELLAMKARTEKRVKNDAEYILRLTREHDDLKLMLGLIAPKRGALATRSPGLGHVLGESRAGFDGQIEHDR